jgi:hypothetical protein
MFGVVDDNVDGGVQVQVQVQVDVNVNVDVGRARPST